MHALISFLGDVLCCRSLTLWLLTLCLMAHAVSAQSRIDSLMQLAAKSQPDTIRIEALLSLSRSYGGSRDSALWYAEQALSLSQEIEDPFRTGKSYLQLTRIHDAEGNLLAARKNLEGAEQVVATFYHPILKANVYHYLGVIDYFEAKYDDAVSHLWIAHKLYDSLGQPSQVADCYLTIGTSYRELGKTEEALAYYERALGLYEQEQNEQGVAMALGNMGTIYRRQHANDKALMNYQRSLRFNRKHSRWEDIIVDLGNIGELHMELKAYDSAKRYLTEAIALSKEQKNEHLQVSTLLNLGTIEYNVGNYASAISTLEEVLSRAQLGNYRDIVKSSYELLSLAYERTGELKRALDYRKEFEAWKDSLISESHLNQVKELEIRYEAERKDQQIALLETEKTLQENEARRQSAIKTASLAGLGLVTLVALLIGHNFRQKLKNQRLLAQKDTQLSEEQFKRQLSELELKALRAQINPHFLFNCMNSINRMILEGENENASQYLAKFSKLVRLILENAEHATVTLDSELALLESYIQLEALRFKGKIQYKIKVAESVDAGATYLPSMVLQPFVENAIWHGLMHKDEHEQGYVEVTIAEKNGSLFCSIQDNGVGRQRARELADDSLLKSKSLGMKITEERLRLLSKKSLEKLVEIVDLKDSLNNALGTRVEICFPVVV